MAIPHNDMLGRQTAVCWNTMEHIDDTVLWFQVVCHHKGRPARVTASTNVCGSFVSSFNCMEWTLNKPVAGKF